MPVAASPSVNIAVQRIVRALDPQCVIMFGSQAAGTAHASSDVDLLIVLEKETHAGDEVRRARQLVAPCFPPIDVVICTAEQTSQAGSEEFYFLRAAVESGVVLYKKQK